MFVGREVGRARAGHRGRRQQQAEGRKRRREAIVMESPGRMHGVSARADVERSVARVAAVRSAVDTGEATQIKLRGDANGAWDEATALAVRERIAEILAAAPRLTGDVGAALAAASPTGEVARPWLLEDALLRVL